MSSVCADAALAQNFNQADRQCSSDDIVGFMNATQSFMDSTDWIERYAWFGAMENLQGVNQVGNSPQGR